MRRLLTLQRQPARGIGSRAPNGPCARAGGTGVTPSGGGRAPRDKAATMGETLAGGAWEAGAEACCTAGAAPADALAPRAKALTMGDTRGAGERGATGSAPRAAPEANGNGRQPSACARSRCACGESRRAPSSMPARSALTKSADGALGPGQDVPRNWCRCVPSRDEHTKHQCLRPHPTTRWRRHAPSRAGPPEGSAGGSGRGAAGELGSAAARKRCSPAPLPRLLAFHAAARKTEWRNAGTAAETTAPSAPTGSGTGHVWRAA